jgi:hypothetical protein
MKSWLVFCMSSLFIGCASLSKGYIYNTDDAAILDSSYAYGYAIVGEQSKLQIVFRNYESRELKTYSKIWADNGVHKEHIFAFSLPPGNWELEQMKTEGGKYGGYRHDLRVRFEIRKGFGNFLGKFETRENPVYGLMADTVKLMENKREIDAYMAGKYGKFKVEQTLIAPRK